MNNHHETPSTKEVNQTDEIYNISQAATFLKISPLTIYRLRKKGKIKFYRVGTRITFSKNKHLLPFIDSCEAS